MLSQNYNLFIIVSQKLNKFDSLMSNCQFNIKITNWYLVLKSSDFYQFCKFYVKKVQYSISATMLIEYCNLNVY